MGIGWEEGYMHWGSIIQSGYDGGAASPKARVLATQRVRRWAMGFKTYGMGGLSDSPDETEGCSCAHCRC